MLAAGPAKKVTIYVGEDVHHHGEPLYLAVLNYLFSHRVSGAMVIKGVAGFGTHHRLHTTRILEISENLPVKIEFVERQETLETLMPELLKMVDKGLVVTADVDVVVQA